MRPYIVTNKRLHTSNESTLGLCFMNDTIPWAFIIEDEFRKVKVMQETRIPAGIYELGIRDELTPLTVKHRNNPIYKPWFKFHIEVLNVDNFSGIYWHLGYKEKHTAGCQLGGFEAQIKAGEFECSPSLPMMKEFYGIIYPKLEMGETVLYHVIN